jgi:hypothetical protein
MTEPSTREKIRRVRLGNVRTLIRHRCGLFLPEDDAGHEYLIEMLKIVSLGPDPERRMVNVIETVAPHITGADGERIIRHVNRMSTYDRWPRPHILGESLRLTNAEREGLGLWSITPCDISAEDLAEQRKAKDRARKRRTRQAQGAKLRSQYEGQSASRLKPWLAEGISRRTWYRRKQMAQVRPDTSTDVAQVRPR